MKLIILLTLLITNSVASDSKHDDYYDFLQPLIINLEQNQSHNSFNKQKALLKFETIAKVAPKSKEFYSLNYKLIQNFQYQHFNVDTKDKDIYNAEKNHFIKILKSIKEPSFFTLYSKLYLETLDSKRLKHKDIMRLYTLSSNDERPYVQLLSYVDSLNQLNSISFKDQNNLHHKLTLLLNELPKKQQEYILRLTSLQLLPLYDKKSIEFSFNKLFAQNSTISRDSILQTLNFKDAKLFHEYIMKKKRSFFEERVFRANMKALKRNDVAMILSTLYMQENNFTEARSYIRQTPRNNLYSLYNPFSSSIEIDNKREYKKSSSLRKFAETMSRLEEKLEGEPPKARDYYLYGNGFYNKSWFGNFPMSSVFFHNEDIYKNNIPATCNLEKAQKAYESALKIATKEKFKAEIAYQLLKIEFNMAMINSKNYTNEMNTMPKANETKNIKQLLKSSRSFIEAIKDYRSDYAHTAYGERVIKESILFTYL